MPRATLYSKEGGTQKDQNLTQNDNFIEANVETN